MKFHTISITLQLPATYAQLQQQLIAQFDIDLRCTPIHYLYNSHGVTITPPSEGNATVEAGDISIDDDSMLVYVDDECIGATDELQEHYPLVYLLCCTSHTLPTEF